MRTALYVALGSGIGGVGRVLVGAAMIEWVGSQFPYGILAVNVAGSFAIGLVAAITMAEGRVLMGPAVRQFFLAGVCGGFTTFSFFSLQTLHLLQAKAWLPAGFYIAGTLLFSMLAVALGYAAGVKLNRPRGESPSS